MKKLLSLTLCLAMIFGVIAANAVSFTAEEIPAEEETAAAAPETEAPAEESSAEPIDETAAEDTADVTPATEPQADLAPVGADADIQETGDVVPVNLGNSFYANIKMTKKAGYFVTSPTKAAQKAIIYKTTGYNNQVWHFTREGTFYRIRSVSLNSYLEMSGSEAKEGDALIFAAKRNAAEQKWIISQDCLRRESDKIHCAAADR